MACVVLPQSTQSFFAEFRKGFAFYCKEHKGFGLPNLCQSLNFDKDLKTSEPQNLRTSEPQNLRTSEPQNLRTSEPKKNLCSSEPLQL
ncbi:hypothetical protein EAH81_15520 [Flavobacterium pectinovorum]|uniref:Uncharacterized protein n=1 Tax=Flavobacterium pectinovorum TaxID=29533 RepID=A0A502EMA0_9FLAO|nr:hypothetical protein EAH81_15520 [Flavobacterium pectinovorum]